MHTPDRPIITTGISNIPAYLADSCGFAPVNSISASKAELSTGCQSFFMGIENSAETLPHEQPNNDEVQEFHTTTNQGE